MTATPYNLAGINACAMPCYVTSLWSMLAVSEWAGLACITAKMHLLQAMKCSAKFCYSVNQEGLDMPLT